MGSRAAGMLAGGVGALYGGLALHDRMTMTPMRKQIYGWRFQDFHIKLSNRWTDATGGGPMLTLPELAQHNGGTKSTIYFGAAGVIYDVTDSESFQPGGAYAKLFPGRDATYALAKMSLEAKDVNVQAWSKLTDEDNQTITEWLAYFDERYTRVARLREYVDKEEYADSNARFMRENAAVSGVHTLPSGLQYRVIKAAHPSDTSTAPPIHTYTPLSINYTGRLACDHGGVISSTFDTHGGVKVGRPIICRPEDMIPGWAEALMLMRPGDRWEVFVPPDLAFGDRGDRQIRPGSALIFDIQLLQVVPRPAVKSQVTKSGAELSVSR